LTRLKFYNYLSIFHFIYFRRVGNTSKMRYQRVRQHGLARYKCVFKTRLTTFLLLIKLLRALFLETPLDIFESPSGQKNSFFSEYLSNFNRNCAMTLFFWDINLDFRDSQRRENEHLLYESGNQVSQKTRHYLGPQSSLLLLEFWALLIICPIYLKNTHKGYIGL
jgi:hypothetical protein